MGYLSPRKGHGKGSGAGMLLAPPSAIAVRQLGQRAMLLAALFLLSLVALLYVSSSANHMSRMDEHWHGGERPIEPLISVGHDAFGRPTDTASAACTDEVTGDDGACAMPTVSSSSAVVATALTATAQAAAVASRPTDSRLVAVPTPTGVLPPGTEDVYKLGHADLPSYQKELESFVAGGYPEKLQTSARKMLASHFNGSAAVIASAVWHAKRPVPDDSSYSNWTQTTYNASAVSKWASGHIEGSVLYVCWSSFSTISPLPVDLWRYLSRALPGFGGYAPFNDSIAALVERNSMLSSAPAWSVNAPDALVSAAPAVIVEIRTDVGSNVNWTQTSVSRPLEFDHANFAAAPGHPILVDVLRRVNESAALVAKARAARDQRVAELLSEAEHLDSVDDLVAEELKAEAEAVSVDPLVEPEEVPFGFSAKRVSSAGVATLMETDVAGTALFTDAVLSYLRARYGINWTSLRELKAPIRIGEVAILPLVRAVKVISASSDAYSSPRGTSFSGKTAFSTTASRATSSVVFDTSII